MNIMEVEQIQDSLEKFPKFLEKKKASPSYIKVSMSTVKNWILTEGITFEKISDHIGKMSKEEIRTGMFVWAFRNFFEMLERDDLLKEMPKMRVLPKKYMGNYLPQSRIRDIVNAISDPVHQLVARIQNESGVRSHEVFKIERRNIKPVMKTEEDYDLWFYIIGKGGKSRYFFVTKPTEKAVIDFLQSNSKERPFLRGRGKDLNTNIDSNVRYYRRSLLRAVRKVGIERFTSHDFRRNFIQDSLRKAKEMGREGILNKEPLLYVRDLVGHAHTSTTEKYLKDMPIEDVEKFIRSIRE